MRRSAHGAARSGGAGSRSRRLRDRARDPGAGRADPARAGARRDRLVVRRGRFRRLAAAAREPHGPADDPGRDRLVRARPRLVRLGARRARQRALAEPLPRARRAPARRLPERLRAVAARAAASSSAVYAPRGSRLRAKRAQRDGEHSSSPPSGSRSPSSIVYVDRPALARGGCRRAARASAAGRPRPAGDGRRGRVDSRTTTSASSCPRPARRCCAGARSSTPRCRSLSWSACCERTCAGRSSAGSSPS